MPAAENARKLLAILLAAPAVMALPILFIFEGIWRESWLFSSSCIVVLMANVTLAVGVWRLARWAPVAAWAWLVAGVCWFAAFFTAIAKVPSLFDVCFLVLTVGFGIWLARYLQRAVRKAAWQNEIA